ncbi:TrbI/VirB10 family protein, partial [Moraxella catarrhalis]|uniref:TrbI/VirB10 family protein n=1 Tax=Moraxella catarrhalis TaxID=480 RepID=UPI002228823A
MALDLSKYTMEERFIPVFLLLDTSGSMNESLDDPSRDDSTRIASSENKLLRTITADRMIPAILITPISSEIGGSKIVAQVESDIYATMGRAVLIPKG